MNYNEYLKSDWWQSRRKIALDRDMVCQHCGSGKKLRVHHLSYEHLWKEEDSDLMVLCSDCHDKVHGEKPSLCQTYCGLPVLQYRGKGSQKKIKDKIRSGDTIALRSGGNVFAIMVPVKKWKQYVIGHQ